MKVKNGSCIRHLSFKTLMAARKRNIIAVLAIALTALLFTSLFTIVMSINETNQNYQFRSVGGYAHGAFKDVDEDQIAVLSAHPDVKAVGVRTVLGLATQGAFEKDYAEVSYMDDNNAKWSFSQPTVGRTPKSGNEITMDTKALELLGVKPELGAQVKVTYTLADKEQMGWDITDTFTLVGWWDYDELLSVHFLNVSKEYAQKIEKKAVAGGLKPFRTDLSVMLRSSLNIENDLTRIGEDCGYSIGEEAGQLRIGVNWGYTATQIWDTLGVGGILAMLAVLILVAFTGYLVIYNIFQISVAGDIRYYGLGDWDAYRQREAAWLKEVVRSEEFRTAPVRIVLIHMIPGGEASWYGEQQIRQLFVPELVGKGIDLMLCGHYHRYQWIDDGSRGVDFPILVNSNNDCLRVSADPKGIDLKVIDTSGAVIERHRIDKK